MTDEKVYLERWEPVPNDLVAFHYPNGKTLYVTKKDFDRAFGTMIQCTYDELKRDFAVK